MTLRSSSLRSTTTTLRGLGLFLVVLVSVGHFQLSDGFEVVRKGRQCSTTTTTDTYFPVKSVDVNDLERFASLLLLTDPATDLFEVDMAVFTSTLNEFRRRTSPKCAEEFFPLAGTSNTAVGLKPKTRVAVREAIDICMCSQTRNWMLNKLLNMYKCDWPAGHQVDLWRRIKRKAKRFNRFVRFQLAVDGNVDAVNMFDALVDRCVFAYIDEQIDSLKESGGYNGQDEAEESEPAAAPSTSSKTPTPTPTPTPQPKTKKPTDKKTKHKVTPPPGSSGSDPSSPPTGDSTRPSTTPPEDPVDLAADASSTMAGLDVGDECRPTCTANEVLAGELSVLARKLSALLVAATFVIVLVAVAVLVAVGVVCRRAWRSVKGRQGYELVTPTEE